jgi:hypothetical protein
MTFSDYIVYADESGDHSLTSINPQHPVFVLVFCVVKISNYVENIVPEFQRLKFAFLGARRCGAAWARYSERAR